MIWILLIILSLVVFFIYSKIVDPSDALYKKVLRKAEENLENIEKDPKLYYDPKRSKENFIETISEIRNDHELYLRLQERYSDQKLLKKIKSDYYQLIHAEDEINTIVGIDPSRMEDQLQKYYIKVEEIGKRFRSYAIEKKGDDLKT